MTLLGNNILGPSGINLQNLHLPTGWDRNVKSIYFLDPPFSPCNLRVTAYDVDFISIAWDKPSNDGGSALLRYIVERREAQRSTWILCGSTKVDKTEFTSSNLIEGESYFFRVAAENQVGRGEYAETIDTQKARLPYGKESL